jgi:putative heme-binding domain-containing protein
LALTGEAHRGEQIFFRSSAAQCNNCHAVRGKGKNIGPDLSNIGRKYAKGALLETILEPSKAISHEYKAYLLETSSGQVFAGFLVQQTDEQVVLKDIKGNLIRVPADEVEALVEQEKSLMPELVLQQVTAQDAADLLAFLTMLTEGYSPVTMYRVVGPFAIQPGDLASKLPPEATLGSPDFSATFAGPGDKQLKWEVVQATGDAFPAVDSVAFDRSRGMPNENVAHYAVVLVESAAEQPATLEIGSDDGVVVWVNGNEVLRKNVSRAMEPKQEQVQTTLKPGRNIVALKVINGGVPGGWTTTIRTREPIQLLTE